MIEAGTHGFGALLIQIIALEVSPISTVAHLVSGGDNLTEPVYTVMSEITFPADGTAVLELPRMYPFGLAVSRRLMHWMGDFLVHTSTSDQSALLHWRSFCLQFQYFLVFGLLGTGYCNDRDRSRLCLVGKGSMAFSAGSVSFYITAR